MRDGTIYKVGAYYAPLTLALLKGEFRKKDRKIMQKGKKYPFLRGPVGTGGGRVCRGGLRRYVRISHDAVITHAKPAS